jgi:hypothetical protein
MALIVLRDLVENQLPCLSGEEAGVFELIFQLREDPSRTVSRSRLSSFVLSAHI